MDIIEKLLKELYRFYPIGLPHIYQTYDGYINFVTTKQKWISDLEKKDSAIYMLNRLFKDIAISKHCHFYLEYYSEIGFKFNLVLNQNEFFIQSFILNISPITNYFTIYIEDVSILRKRDAEENRESIVKTFSYYLNSCDYSEIKGLANYLREQVSSIFSGYVFISHKILMTTFILGGCPYSENRDNFEIAKENIAMFEFLFGKCGPLSNSSVCS
ncbi:MULTISPECIES: hypothetical protein [Chitinophagaceae]